jgi:hypothetical protein
MKFKYPKFFRARWFIASISFLVGLLVLAGIRFATYHPEEAIHYHANFAIYLNGQRELFKSPMYYTEIEDSCSVGEKEVSTHERAHMHDNINDVVHVEDHAVTWGHFFQNLGWVVDKDVIRTDTQILLPDSNNKITFVLNDKPVDFLTNRVIGDTDRLLVNYGMANQQALQKVFKTVPATAAKYDTAQDPASCSGHKTTTTRDRLMHLF